MKTIGMKTIGMKTIGMKTQAIKVKLRDGEMGAYVAIPDGTPAGAIIAIMEIWPNRIQRDLTGPELHRRKYGL